MFIEQGVKSGNKFSKYIWGSLLIIFASFVGQLVFLVALLYKSFVNTKPYPTSNEAVMNYFDSNLTLLLIMISFVFTMLGVIFVVRNVHNQSLQSITTSRKKVDWSRIIFSFFYSLFLK